MKGLTLFFTGRQTAGASENSVGLVSDCLVDLGGTVILTEDTEMIGTSHILERRACSIGYPIVPVIKVASTGRMYDRMADDMDVNAGVILDGAPMQAVGKEIIDIMRNVLDGEPTKAELNQQEGIVCLYTSHPAM